MCQLENGCSLLVLAPKKEPVLSSPAMEYLPPPRASASHTGENLEDPTAGLR